MLRADVAVTIIHTSTEAISAIYPTEGRPRAALIATVNIVLIEPYISRIRFLDNRVVTSTEVGRLACNLEKKSTCMSKTQILLHLYRRCIEHFQESGECCTD